MHSIHKDASIDSLRRNATDGAYHCPRCDAPFTRRSNLRRHYHIHTRNMVHKCQHCNQSFAKSEELHSHSVQCGATTWDQSTDRMIQAMTQYTPDTGLSHNIEFAGGLGIVGTPIHEHPPGLSDDFINVDLFQQTDPLKADQATHEFQDFFSSISSALSESASSPSTSSEILSASAVSFPFPYPSHTPGTASTNSSNKSSPSPPSTIFSSGSYSFGVSPEERANSISRWNSYNMMMSLNEANAGEKPMYTQKQVEDMLDMVGNCFLDTIDAVLQRAQAVDLPLVGQEISELQTLVEPQQNSLSVEARRMILVETIPRLMSCLRDDRYGANRPVISP
ncbi:hypothetical protein AGABI1DRAFT_114132 [Agaricus bisporus var. burnettii JB137-S8]|uniref:C2H2-type domain-containing protein n=2 Tax=Agaricus bisporus var. burnettii TaxID=192524 RepID=K5X9F8_AGABU|nr:hypothetical protein AGABI2DRAFT_193980 [Agaricus bisporus var. bisporus H97]XP_007330245.1 uncharacterized protein AGABI1DRAFT_114132 [Agaricus bisporus var. burnettii JB137-S8]EKM79632.1 hypothetical protein AGABI1DRAFT_114132 [Agaricus bisporus var. burnettii JB137-S8]EKV46102.1 hypothetical protein AGABI2DRAFT_193980 [Agaricus bisporus var. bisporus H97]KAF7768664.1 transcriptional regulator family: C2H2 zinc finger [Agaricus bisporus var. burnettii]